MGKYIALNLALFFIALFSLPAPSHAAELDGIYECNRTKLNTTGFRSKAGAESWFPQIIPIEIRNNKAQMFDLTSQKVRYKSNKVVVTFKVAKETLVFEVRPSKMGKSYLSILARSGYQQTSPNHYQCNRTNNQSAMNLNSSSADANEEIIFVPNATDLNPTKTEDVNRAINLASNSRAMSEDQKSVLLSSKFIREYIGKSSPKAMAKALPDTCNYKYYYTSNQSIQNAISKAFQGCSRKMDEYNELMDKNCQCKIAAVNNAFFHSSESFLGELGFVPMIAEVSQNGQSIIIKGTAEWGTPGKSVANFVVKNENDVEICNGQFDTRNTAKGSIEMNCFDGKFSGSGTFVNSGFDPDLRFFNGTAKIELGGNVTMRVIYGRDAM